MRQIKLMFAVSAACLAGVCVCADPAMAQSASSSASSFTQGYRTNLSALQNPVNVTTRDANGNLVITDGVIQNGTDNSIFSKRITGGTLDTLSGVGATGSATATAIGNNLNVTVTGNNNTVIVNATQTNNGSVTASTVLNGKVNLNGQ
ncbi:MAG: holdfast anchoring protein HfaA [Pseudomonadota bacterium]|jgi:holdfast attachment protein HfaA